MSEERDNEMGRWLRFDKVMVGGEARVINNDDVDSAKSSTKCRQGQRWLSDAWGRVGDAQGELR